MGRGDDNGLSIAVVGWCDRRKCEVGGVPMGPRAGDVSWNRLESGSDGAEQ